MTQSHMVCMLHCDVSYKVTITKFLTKWVLVEKMTVNKKVFFNRSQSVGQCSKSLCRSAVLVPAMRKRSRWSRLTLWASAWEAPLWRKSLTGLLRAPTTVANQSLLVQVGPDSFLPPHFGFLDRTEVRVVDHVVLAGLCRGNDAAGRKHGVLFICSWIILNEGNRNKNGSTLNQTYTFHLKEYCVILWNMITCFHVES